MLRNRLQVKFAKILECISKSLEFNRINVIASFLVCNFIKAFEFPPAELCYRLEVLRIQMFIAPHQDTIGKRLAEQVFSLTDTYIKSGLYLRGRVTPVYEANPGYPSYGEPKPDKSAKENF